MQHIKSVSRYMQQVFDPRSIGDALWGENKLFACKKHLQNTFLYRVLHLQFICDHLR